MPDRIKLIFILFFSSICCLLQAQPTLDTIQFCLKQKPTLYAKFDTRNSFISNSRAKIFGIKTGLSFGKRLHLGFGYNQLYPSSTNFDKLFSYTASDNTTQSTIAKFRIYYVSADVEYIFYQTKHWELSMPLQIGIGKTYYVYRLLNENKITDENWNFIYEPAVSIEYKFVKWIGIGADIGYRFMITQDRRLNQNFNSPNYAFKFLIYYNEIYKSLFPKSRLAKNL